MNIYQEIEAERNIQRQKWGDRHDYVEHGSVVAEWARLFKERIAKAEAGSTQTVVRRQFIILAALTVAAIETFDRSTLPAIAAEPKETER